jgi:hypothetical protein
MKMLQVSSLLFLLACSSLHATEPVEGKFRLEQLSWLSGDWRIDQHDQFVQEHWLEPVNGFMSGVFRLFDGARLVVHEYILLSQEGRDVILRFKHFNADYSTWEKDEPLKFRLSTLQEGYALFENVDPQPAAADLIEYSRSGNALTATVSDRPGPEAGEAMVFRFKLHRKKSEDL